MYRKLTSIQSRLSIQCILELEQIQLRKNTVNQNTFYKKILQEKIIPFKVNLI